MLNKRLLSILTATTLLTTGVALAANQNADGQQLSPQQNAADHAFGKLSADGARAYQDIGLTRLAIFDGRIDDAKKAIGDADAGFAKAKSDESVFTKAEADLKMPPNQAHAPAPNPAPQASGAQASGAQSNGAQASNAKTPIAWLPVDGTVSVDEDYSVNPSKAAAVSDANKSLKAGDAQGAVAKLKLADINMGVTLAVVPLNQTISDVHQAVGMINDGKYYEASQLLRQVQNGERFDVASISGTPQPSASAQKPAAPSK